MHRNLFNAFLVASLLTFPVTAMAQTGASEDRVSLPEGPGSLEGVGENVDIDPNMGMMRYNIGISVPSGFDEVTPKLGLSYSSGGGNSVVGMGWSMDMPAIERMTYRRLPLYTPQDDFAFGGSDQLVRIPDTNPPVYRSRFESGFVLYTWMNQGDGAQGYWIAEWPDGTRGFFGADARGNLVSEARVGDPSLGTFRYQLVEKVDVYGHKEVWSYQKFGQYSLPTRIGYVFVDGEPSYEVTFQYEDRRDEGGVDYLSDAAPGFNLLLTRRMSRVDVLSHGQALRHYELSYEPYETSGGFTRMTQVAFFSHEGNPYPTTFGFQYSRTLGGVCEGQDCQRPFMMDMGTLGVNLGAGQATLIDINGDALPDVVDASQDGPHRFFLNIAEVDGTSHFEAEPRVSRVGTKASHNLQAAAVQVLDLNGDGFTDMLNAATGEVLLNLGEGDWSDGASTEGVAELAEALSGDFNAEEGDFQTLKFIDYNNDKFIDVMRSTPETTTVFRNRGADGFEIDEDVEAIGAGFAEDGLQFADMNGDGLLDVVRLRPQTILYKLNHGWGRWGDWVEITDLPIDSAAIESEFVELEDINGDGLADLVLVQADTVTFALNTNTVDFTAPTVLDSADVEGDIPLRAGGVTVLYADMNGNGSSDIVWISPNGHVQVLELFPIRPNLMSQVTNDLGQVTEISYTTSAVQMALDGGWEAWPYKLPFPMLVVASMDQYDLHSNLHEITEYRYHDGFYDGIEKQFRGYARSETIGEGDEFQESGLVEMVFDVGAEDVYRNGLKLSQTTFSDGRELNISETFYDDCPVAEVPDNTELPVRYICQTGTRETIKEGLDASRWVVKETVNQYDGYGNVTLASDLGVTSIGGGGCEPCDRPDDEFGRPCGAQCLGDELYTESTYVSTANTDGRWIIHASSSMRTRGRLDGPVFTEETTYYDGPAFVGLPQGQLTIGDATRVTVKVRAGENRVIEKSRTRRDEHGNVIEALDANGDIDGNTHRTIYTMDPTGLRVVRMEELLEDAEGEPYRLRRDFVYGGLFERLESATRYMVVRNGQVQGEEGVTRYLYDEFGRLAGRVMPGDSLEAPTEEYEYDMGNPVSRIIARRRSQVGGPLDQATVSCYDGRGRLFQVLNQLEEGRWQADGFQRFNVRGEALRAYQPYTKANSQCDDAPPQNVGFVQTRRDAAGRVISRTLPDAASHGTASVERMVYEPLLVRSYDAEDTDPDSPHFDTPRTSHTDGLGRTVAIERFLSPNGPAAVTEYHYSELGFLSGYTDPEGNRKVQTFDLLGRPVEVDDPNGDGLRITEYDDNGNEVRVEDERGVVVRTVFDGKDRPTERFDEADREGTLIRWTYDAPEICLADECTHTSGLLAEVSYPGLDGERASDRFGYDLRDRLVYRARHLGGHTFDYHFTHDNIDRVVEATYPDGQTLTRTWDGGDRLTSVAGIVDEVTYDQRAQRAGTRCADGTASVVSYDSMMRPTRRVITGAGGELLAGWGVTFDRMNNPLAVEDLSEANGALPRGAVYKYDPWYRLTEATIAQGSADQETLNYSYDDIENFTGRTSSLGDESPALVGPMTYGAFGPNAISGAGGVSMTYDAAGNMVGRGDDALSWDYLSRLASMTAGGQTQENIYGSDEMRVARREGDGVSLYLSDDFIVRDGIVELYVNDGLIRMARLESDTLATTLLSDLALEGETPDGQINAADAYLADAAGQGRAQLNSDAPSAPGALLRSSVRRLLLESGPDDGVSFLHHDHTMTPLLATGTVNGQLEVVGQRRFYPYGQEHPHSVGFVDAFSFSGQEFDPTTGLLYFGARHYDPRLGRWLSPDPAFETVTDEQLDKQLGDATSAYAFVVNNPVARFDPTGNDTEIFVPYHNDSAVKSVLGKSSFHKKGSKKLGGVSGGSSSTLKIVGHGNMGSAIGGHSPWSHYGPKSLVKLLKSEGLKPGDYGGMTISLIACNAGSHVKGVTGTTPPFAERFAKELHKAGFTGVTVEGFSGFVTSLSGSGYRTHDHKTGKQDGADFDSAFMKVSYEVGGGGVSGVAGSRHAVLSPSKTPWGKSVTKSMGLSKAKKPSRFKGFKFSFGKSKGKTKTK